MNLLETIILYILILFGLGSCAGCSTPPAITLCPGCVVVTPEQLQNSMQSAFEDGFDEGHTEGFIKGLNAPNLTPL
jgi:hypothetical protein